MPAVRKVYVDIRGFGDWKRQATNRGLTHLASWARKAIRGPEIYGKTPVDTGQLRDNTDTRVEAGQNLTIWFYWRQPYAEIVEEAWYGKYSPRTPGTRAPYAVPGVTEAAHAQEFRSAVKRMLEG